jgi:hypothetical protein
MKLSNSNKAISPVIGASVLIATIAGVIIGLSYFVDVTSCNMCKGSNVPTVHVEYETFNFMSDTFYFKLSTPPSYTSFKTTTLNSVTVNKTACNGNFPPIAKNETLMLSCVVSGVNFDKGQILVYALNFTDGESDGGDVTAQ